MAVEMMESTRATALTGTTVGCASVCWNGVMQSGSSNFSTNYNTNTKRYEITIAGVNYDRLQYVAVANPSGWGNKMSFINTDSLNGKLVIDVRDANGNLIQNDFAVVVFHR